MNDESDETHGILQNTITIKGSYFSTKNEENIISFGGFPCVAKKSSADEVHLSNLSNVNVV